MKRPFHFRLARMAPAAAALALASVVHSLPSTDARPAASKGPIAPPPLSPRFQQVRDRINDLFHHRDEQPAAPDPKDNPFRAAGQIVVASRPGDPHAASTAAAPPEAGSDLALLQQAGATLKVSGVVTIDGKQHLIINGKPYKEGDAIQAQAQGQPIVMRIKQITRYTITLGVNDAETTVKF